MLLQQDISKQRNEALIGKLVQVIVDGDYAKDNNCFFGRTQIDAPDIDGGVIIAKKSGIKSGDIVTVKINEAFEYDLKGEIIDESSK